MAWNPEQQLNCPNEFCQAPNPLKLSVCQNCSTPIPKRYLWAVNDDLDLGQPGDILAERYLIINQNVVLDTKPGLSPQTPQLDKIQEIQHYLRLFSLQLHVPQVYGVLSLDDGGTQKEILLLEKPPIIVREEVTPFQAELVKDLSTAWKSATSMQQLNCLWQIANLWEPLASECVASSLLEPNLLRVEGSLVRLLELRTDLITPQLYHLGILWQLILTDTQPCIAQFVKQVCFSLIDGEIQSPQQLIAVLNQGICEIELSQISSINISTKTDVGTNRIRNEDACFPASDSVIQEASMTIVCDGMSDHNGDGQTASKIAINTIQTLVSKMKFLSEKETKHEVLLQNLEKLILAANDKVIELNESQVGHSNTTFVMALPIANSMYITHMGKCRAYWITRHGCYQVTIDDDFAAREVRNGNAIYHNVSQQLSPFLSQALGSKNIALQPTTQRLILDTDCVFLLCSDGLSYGDKVEQHWQTEILPILKGEIDVKTATNRLVEIANTENGFDNVTVALIHYQVQYSEPQTDLRMELPSLSAPVEKYNSINSNKLPVWLKILNLFTPLRVKQKSKDITSV